MLQADVNPARPERFKHDPFKPSPGVSPAQAPATPCTYDALLRANAAALLRFAPKEPGAPLVLWLDRVYELSGLPAAMEKALSGWKGRCVLQRHACPACTHAPCMRALCHAVRAAWYGHPAFMLQHAAWVKGNHTQRCHTQRAAPHHTAPLRRLHAGARCWATSSLRRWMTTRATSERMRTQSSSAATSLESSGLYFHVCAPCAPCAHSFTGV
jgi:hypothetical protein